MRAFSVVRAAKECWYFPKTEDTIICKKVIIELILLPNQFVKKNVFVIEMRRKLVVKPC
jgi:hypothetical protein